LAGGKAHEFSWPGEAGFKGTATLRSRLRWQFFEIPFAGLAIQPKKTKNEVSPAADDNVCQVGVVPGIRGFGHDPIQLAL
jgi:hypothetical protein